MPDALPGVPATPLTELLHLAHQGDAQAAQAAYRQLYPELLRIARSRLRGHQAPTLLDTEALVHESVMRFMQGPERPFESRKHFYAYAAKAMRHIVVDFVRRTQAGRRGGDATRLTWDTALGEALPGALPGSQPGDVLDLERALQALAEVDPQLAELTELRCFGGYTDAEVAEALGLGERGVRRLWDKARAFLQVQLGR
ncbi:MAG: sigma-70 family RNA polymerase sigma factor [Rubrivivax sp.]|nr:sigma-70 family RNA polymerase sigma factor [Rubrivivax sp.]